MERKSVSAVKYFTPSVPSVRCDCYHPRPQEPPKGEVPEYQPPPTSGNESELRKDGRRSHVTLQPSEFWQGRWFYKKTLNSYQIKARSLAWRFRLSAVWVSSPLSPATARATPLPVHPPPSHFGDSALTTCFVSSLLSSNFHLGICQSLTGAHSNTTFSMMHAYILWEMVPASVLELAWHRRAPCGTCLLDICVP